MLPFCTMTAPGQVEASRHSAAFLLALRNRRLRERNKTADAILQKLPIALHCNEPARRATTGQLTRNIDADA